MEEGQNQPQIAHKPSDFQEIAEKGEEDRISSLPDCLILEILSRLPSTKDAIRTSTLSKRWSHLWTLLPKLVISYDDVLSQALKNPTVYIISLDKTLTQCRQSKLELFVVHGPYESRFESLFNNWIHFALSCNVKGLGLDFWHKGRETEFRLDPSLFINSHLTHLALVGCMLNPIGAISWPNLRSLRISHMNLDEDLVLNLLSGCPQLETLYLRESFISEHEDDDIQINAPKSLSLTRCPQLKLKKFEVSCNFDSNFELQLNSWIGYAIRCNVKKLIIEFWNTETGYELMLDQIVFTTSCFTELELKGCVINPVGAISWKNLRSLCISSWNLNEDLIQNILSGSPVLESLELYLCWGFERLDITSKSVKKLVISDCRIPLETRERDTIEINAPNILSLTI